MTPTLTPNPPPEPATEDAQACATTPAASAMNPDTATHIARILKATADPLRLRILSTITASSSHEACVCDFLDLDHVTQPTVSHHLKVMRDAGILASERRGTWVYYRVADALVAPITALVEGFAHAVSTDNDRPHTDGLRDVDAALGRVAQRLTSAFPDLDPTMVTYIVRESYAGLARHAHVTSHLVPLAERFARQRLDDVSRSTSPTTTPQVLFVCTRNAGRSQLAAALMRLHAGDRVVVRSAGSAPASEIHAQVREELATINAPYEDPFPKPLTDDAVRAADVVVTMGCGDVCPVIPGVSYEDWPVGDPAVASRDGVRAIRADIDRRVRDLLSRLV